MERGASNGFQRLPKSNSGTKMNQSTADMSAAEQDGACNVREQDRFMPIANVIRIMRRILPTHAKISDDAKETIQECVSEYISFITSEANDRCQREQRKTITAEDVLWAMGKLGFDEYIQPLTLYLQRYREFEGERGASMRGGGAAGDPLLKRSMSELSPLAAAAYNPAAAFHMAHHRGFFAAAGATQPMNSYFRDGSNVGASGQSAMASFDPYAAFK